MLSGNLEGIDSPNYRYDELLLQGLIERYSNHPAAQLESYTYFTGDTQSRAQEKNRFLRGDTRNPELDTPKLEDTSVIDAIHEQQAVLLRMSKDALVLDHDQDRIRVLEGALGSAYLELELLSLSSQRKTAADKKDNGATFTEASELLYGPLSVQKFNGLLMRSREVARGLQQDPTVGNIAEEYLAITREPKGALEGQIKPTNEQILKLREVFLGANEDILSCIPVKEAYTAIDLKEVFEAAHQIRDTGWSVEIIPGKANVSSNQETETTEIGELRKCASALEVAQVLCHENGIHVERRMRSKSSSDPLLAAGRLPGYLGPEEGIATAIEEIIKGEAKESGVQYYLGLGFTLGLDGSPRDFRDTYEVMWRKNVLDAAYKGEVVTEEKIVKVQAATYDQIVRIRRGTDTSLPGVAYTKDQSYYSGNQEVWEYLLGWLELSEEEKAKEMDYLLAAKFNPFTSSQSAIVRKALEK